MRNAVHCMHSHTKFQRVAALLLLVSTLLLPLLVEQVSALWQ